MKRDMELIRKILLATEEKAAFGIPFIELSFDDVPKEVISEHAKLLSEADLIEAEFVDRFAMMLPKRVTWEGHEFLDAARDDTRWKNVKKTVSEKGGSLPFDVIKALAVQLAREAVGLH